MALTLYFFLPMSRDNYYALTSRAFGNTFLVISLLSLFAFYLTSNIAALLAASLAASLVFLTHRLTLQSLVAVMLALTLALWSFFPMIVLISGLLLTIVFTRGYYIKILKAHLDLIITLTWNMRNPKIRAVQPAVYPNPVLFLFNIPVIVLIPFFFSLSGDIRTDFFLIWGLSLVGLSIIWFLGEGYRHLANSTLPFSVLTAVWAVNYSAYPIYAGFLALSVFFTVVKIIRLERDKISILSEPLLDAFAWLKNNCNKEDLVLCLPFDIFQAMHYFTGCRVLQAGGNEAKGILFNRTTLGEEVKNGKLKEMAKEFGIRYILAMGQKEMPGEAIFSSGDVRINKVED